MSVTEPSTPRTTWVCVVHGFTVGVNPCCERPEPRAQQAEFPAELDREPPDSDVGPPCCPQPDWEPEMWRCKHGILWTDWGPDDDDD